MVHTSRATVPRRRPGAVLRASSSVRLQCFASWCLCSAGVGNAYTCTGVRSRSDQIFETLDGEINQYSRMAKACQGVSNETTTDAHRLKETAAKVCCFPRNQRERLRDKPKLDNVYGCRHTFPVGIMRATAVLIGGKRVVCGHGGVGYGSAFAMCGSGACVVSAECDPICAWQACTEGFQVAILESVVGEIDIFVAIAGNFISSGWST